MEEINLQIYLSEVYLAFLLTVAEFSECETYVIPLIFYPHPQGGLAKNPSYPIMDVAFLLQDFAFNISFFHKQFFPCYFCNIFATPSRILEMCA